MPKERSPQRDKAFEIWKNSNGALKLKDIAEQLGVSDTQIRKWKNQDKWDDQLKDALPKANSNVTNKKGTSKGNGNAKKDTSLVTIEPELVIADDEGLTPKQRLFVKYYLIDFNATQASIKAGYSQDTAKEIGSENLTKPLIRTAINKVLNDREADAEFDRYRIINQLAKIAFSDIKDYLSFRTEKGVVGYDDDGPIVDYKQFVELKPSDDVDGTIISEIQETKDGIKFKRLDPMKALELLGRHRGMFQTDVNLKVSGGMKVEHEKHYHITQEIIERSPDLIDTIFSRNNGRSLADRSSEGEPNGV